MSSDGPLLKCPLCQTSDVKKLDGQCVLCLHCSSALRRVYRFCLACQREWSSSCPVNSACNLANCALRAALLSTKRINDPESSVHGCPYFRACPICKALLTHTRCGCPNIVCPQCNTEFCFRCLSLDCDGVGSDISLHSDLYELYDNGCTILENQMCLSVLGL